VAKTPVSRAHRRIPYRQDRRPGLLSHKGRYVITGLPERPSRCAGEVPGRPASVYLLLALKVPETVAVLLGAEPPTVSAVTLTPETVAVALAGPEAFRLVTVSVAVASPAVTLSI